MKQISTIPDLFWMMLILWIGFAVRIAQLGGPSLWLDESITWLIASAPLKEGLQLILADVVHPPLHYLLLHPIAAIDQSEFALRLPSVMAAVLSIPLMYRLGGAMARAPERKRLVSLLAAALLAINPFHVWFAREARSYELVFLLSLLILYTFHHIVQDGRGWIGFFFASTLAYLTHYFALLLIWVQLTYYLLNFRKYHSSFPRWLLVQGLACVPAMLWFVAVFSQESVGAALGWIPQPSLLAPLYTLWNFAILYVENGLWWGVVGLFLFAGVLALGLRARPNSIFLALWLFLPCLTILILFKAMGYGFYVDRYFIISLPAFVVLLARGLGEVRRKWILAGLAAALLLVSAAATIRIYFCPDLSKQDWRKAMSIVAQYGQPDDLKVVEHSMGAIPAVYYQPNLDSRRPTSPYPEGSFRLAVLNRSGLDPWTFLQPRPGEDSLPAILDEYKPQRLWLIYTNPSLSNHRLSSGSLFDIFEKADPATASWLQAHRDLVETQYRLPGISVVLVDTSP